MHVLRCRNYGKGVVFMVTLLKPDKTDLDVLLGDHKKAIRSMFIPLLVAFAVIELNQFVDTFWISGLGRAASEAISVSVGFYGLLMCAGMGISVGATSAIAYRLGQANYERAGFMASNAIILSLILGVISGIVMFVLMDPALDLLGARGVAEECWQYMIPFMVMAPILMAHSVIGGLFRGEGAARKSTIVQMSAALLNIVLDPIFMYVLGMGIMGAGVSTGVSALIALLIGLRWYNNRSTVVRMDRSNFRFEKDAVREIMNVGVPKTIQDFITSFTVFAQRIFIIVAGGTTGVLIYNYPFRITSIFQLPGKALENAMLPIASAAYGQSDIEKMKAAAYYALKITLGLSAIFFVVMVVFSDLFMSVFTYEDSMKSMLPDLSQALKLIALCMPFMAIKGVGTSILQAMKKAKIPMYFDLFWTIVRLILFALSAYGYLGVDPFQGIMFIMVSLNVYGGAIVMMLALWQLRKLSKAFSAAGKETAPAD
jgi:putative MATE family efflux protein